MKRSMSLSLMLMGSLSLPLAGCGDEAVKEEFMAFTSLNDCARNGEFTMQQCRTMEQEAQRQRPRFASREECEQAFGADVCESNVQPSARADASGAERANGDLMQQSGGSSWMPLMAGYMMGRYLSGGASMQGTQPLFRGPGQQDAARGGMRTAGGSVVQADATGRVANPPQSVRQGFAQSAKPFVARTATTSRGGFDGASSSGRAGS
jgi:uncharacterized protein YgiB involved in biofilm formation